MDFVIQDRMNKLRQASPKGNNLTDDRAFVHLSLKLFFMEKAGFDDLNDQITDGSNDGGIDFVFFDEEQQKVILGQCKCVASIDANGVIEELNKMSSTLQSFLKGQTGLFNANLKRVLQNALDRLPEEDIGNVEFAIFSSSEIDSLNLSNKIENGEYTFTNDMFSLYQPDDFISRIQSEQEAVHTVPEDKIFIDKARNHLEYESSTTKGVLVNLEAKSLIALYNKYADKGLFDLNIRRYIRNKLVDSGITRTIEKDRENFWFFNNGIIIACSEYRIDGNTIKLYNFSIVNGAQTTTIIGEYKGSSSGVFYIPCKIVAEKDEDDGTDSSFYTKIAEATNSQKPIYARDLKSNAPEMRRLHKWLNEEGIFLEIKRGDNKLRPNNNRRIKNDELAQMILSIVLQKPGTSRSGKKTIFENNSIYNSIFRNNYEKDSNKKKFILDLVDLNERMVQITPEQLQWRLNQFEREVFINGRQIILAIIGLLYSLENGDIDINALIEDPEILRDNSFIYSPIIGNYTKDDINKRLSHIVLCIVQIVAESYQKALENNEITSVSNFFKTDKRYYEDIIKHFLTSYTRYAVGKEIKENSVIFKRREGV